MQKKVAPTRKFTIVASDPSLHDEHGRILTAEVEVPNEETLEDGPRGYRVQVIDYDASSGRFYTPWSESDCLSAPGRASKKTAMQAAPSKQQVDTYNRRIIEDPRFHQQNVYAIVMRTLAHFELALGRRVSWSFGQHQLKIAPHAFVEANAFYSARQEGLVFGYFCNARGNTVFTCLSHDIIAHETTHALLDGLQPRYMEASQADQFAFHEGFADVVALLSAFSVKEVLFAAVAKALPKPSQRPILDVSKLTISNLQRGILGGLGEQFGTELGIHGGALRRSVTLKPRSDILKKPEYKEPHRRGEILVAAVLHGLLVAYCERLSTLGKDSRNQLPAMRVAEEGADIAGRILTMAIRAIDYLPPADVTFSDYLSALITSDYEAHPDDSRFELRRRLRESFGAFGIKPASHRTSDGRWEPPDFGKPKLRLEYGLSHFESLQRHRDEVFRFLWINRDELGLSKQAHTQVLSVDPCLRTDRDGFSVRETVASYIQILYLPAGDLSKIKFQTKWDRSKRSRRIVPPSGMKGNCPVKLLGGGSLIFDEFGRLKYHIHNSILDETRQTKRLKELWDRGYFSAGKRVEPSFAELHRCGVSPVLPAITPETESW